MISQMCFNFQGPFITIHMSFRKFRKRIKKL